MINHKNSQKAALTAAERNHKKKVVTNVRQKHTKWLEIAFLKEAEPLNFLDMPNFFT